ncbi:Peptide methionine sulfoxide reductase MsrB [compost metagenome]
MIQRRQLLIAATGLGAAALAAGWLPRWLGGGAMVQARDADETFEVSHSDADWRTLLGPERYEVLRQEGTERPYSSPLNDEHRAGTFVCAGCALPLFSSASKFDSQTGWPSFWQPLENAVATRTDTSFGMARVEVHCRRCGGHLGHVFEDGPKPTGLRYCMNGLALKFLPTAA